MTNEQKQLLLKDLCTRLLYGVQCKIHYTFSNETTFGEDVVTEEDDTLVKVDTQSQSVYFKWFGDWLSIEDVKPYLRPMSSMTEDEQRTLDSMCNGVEMVSRLSGLKMFDKAFDWLNENHFDYRGLIELGLAIRVTPENNPYRK